MEPAKAGHLFWGEGMGEEHREVDVVTACAEQLTAAARSLEEAMGKLEAQYASLNQKVDRIVAAVEQGELAAGSETGLRERLEELERENVALQVQAQRAGRKTLSALTNSVLAKGEFEGDAAKGDALEKALQALSVEQRIAVKAELARAGRID